MFGFIARGSLLPQNPDLIVVEPISIIAVYSTISDYYFIIIKKETNKLIDRLMVDATDQEINSSLLAEYDTMRDEFDFGYILIGLGLVLTVLYLTGVIGGSEPKSA